MLLVDGRIKRKKNDRFGVVMCDTSLAKAVYTVSPEVFVEETPSSNFITSSKNKSITISETAAQIASFAKKSGKSVTEVERLWKRAKVQAENQKGKIKGNIYEHAVGILKNMLGLEEAAWLTSDWLWEPLPFAWLTKAKEALEKLTEFSYKAKDSSYYEIEKDVSNAPAKYRDCNSVAEVGLRSRLRKVTRFFKLVGWVDSPFYPETVWDFSQKERRSPLYVYLKELPKFTKEEFSYLRKLQTGSIYPSRYLMPKSKQLLGAALDLLQLYKSVDWEVVREDVEEKPMFLVGIPYSTLTPAAKEFLASVENREMLKRQMETFVGNNRAEIERIVKYYKDNPEEVGKEAKRIQREVQQKVGASVWGRIMSYPTQFFSWLFSIFTSPSEFFDKLLSWPFRVVNKVYSRIFKRNIPEREWFLGLAAFSLGTGNITLAVLFMMFYFDSSKDESVFISNEWKSLSESFSKICETSRGSFPSYPIADLGTVSPTGEVKKKKKDEEDEEEDIESELREALLQEEYSRVELFQRFYILEYIYWTLKVKYRTPSEMSDEENVFFQQIRDDYKKVVTECIDILEIETWNWLAGKLYGMSIFLEDFFYSEGYFENWQVFTKAYRGSLGKKVDVTDAVKKIGIKAPLRERERAEIGYKIYKKAKTNFICGYPDAPAIGRRGGLFITDLALRREVLAFYKWQNIIPEMRESVPRMWEMYSKYLKDVYVLNSNFDRMGATISIALNTAHTYGVLAEYALDIRGYVAIGVLNRLTSLGDRLPKDTDLRTLKQIDKNWRRLVERLLNSDAPLLLEDFQTLLQIK
jgi:hypothetical protein